MRQGQSPQEAAQQRIESLLTQIRDAVIEPPRPSGTESIEQVIIRVVQVVTTGIIVQGPDIPLSRGYSVSIRQRRHATPRTGYVAFSRSAIGNTLTSSELANNESITGIKIDNFKEAWFNATVNNTFFEIVAVR